VNSVRSSQMLSSSLCRNDLITRDSACSAALRRNFGEISDSQMGIPAPLLLIPLRHCERDAGVCAVRVRVCPPAFRFEFFRARHPGI
jgi:hypothetical protein